MGNDLGIVLADRIRTLIIDTANNAPRSRQKAIGPSEVGEPCVRKLAYKIHDWPAVNSGNDPWASIIGTALHAWMADAFAAKNTPLPDGRLRYKIEERVTIREGNAPGADLAGSSDLYDRATGTTWDWKVSGVSSIAKYRRNGPGQQYRIQAHLYSLGQANAGEAPKRVAVCFLPRHHELHPHVWTEEYQPQIALDALARLDRIYDLVLALDPESNPQAWSAFPTSPDAKCSWCPWFKPGSKNLAEGCPGVAKPDWSRSSLEALIA